jgi:8-amino-7-oxononanoate synthase
MLGLQDLFARILTFENGLGCQGAVILGSVELRDCLVNFAQSFKYTTGLSRSVAAILTGYQHLKRTTNHSATQNIIHFNQEKNMLGLNNCLYTVNQQYNRPSFRVMKMLHP